MSKYIDLEPRISEYYGTEPGLARHAGICDALRYLDSRPGQAPGRTITESDYSDISEWARNYHTRGHEGRNVLANAGITVVPDPEPTNAELLERLIRESEECLQNPDGPVWTASSAAEFLDARGVKAPDK